MPGIGTIVNVLAIIVGGLMGLFGGKLLNERLQDSVIKSCGLATMFLGAGGAFAQMLQISSDGKLATAGSMMMIASLIIGSLVGEIIGIEEKLEQFGEWLKKKTGNGKDNEFVNAFVLSSLTVCIGAMAVVGSIQDGIDHNPTTLFTKSVLDFVIILIMTSSMGKGCIFSALSVGLFQGSITLLSGLLKPVMTTAALANLSFVGSILIFCVGFNIAFGKRFKVGSMLPSLVVAVAAAFII